MAYRPRSRLTTSPGEIDQLQHNEYAYSQRNLDVGGVYTIVGDASTAQRVGMFATLRVVNTDTAAHYIAIGDSSVSAPTSLTDGHYIAPGGELRISTGDLGAYVRTDSNTVGVYKLKD